MSLSSVLDKYFGGRPSVQQNTFIRVKTQFSCLYKQAMLQLYINGFIKDPGRWDKEEIIKSMLDNDMNLVDASGRLTLDNSYILEEVYKDDYKEGIYESFNPEVEFYLDPKNWENYLSNFYKPTTSRMFYLAIRLREILKSLDSMYNSMNFDAKSKRFSQNKIMYTAGVLQNKVRWGINEGSASVIAGYGSSLKYHTYSDGFSKALYAYFNEERPDEMEEGRFIAGVSVAQESELLVDSVDGARLFTGELGNLIYEWNLNNIWENNSLLKKELNIEVRRHDGGDYIEESVRNALDNVTEDEQPLTLDNAGFFTKVKSEEKALHMSGQYVFDSIEDSLLNPSAYLSGMNGELIEEMSEEDAVETTGIELKYNGSPVLVHNGESFIRCQDVDFLGNSEHLHGGKSLFLSLAGNLTFKNESPEVLMQDVDTTTVEGCIKFAFNQSESGYFGPVVGDAVSSASEYSDKIVKVAGELE